MGAKAGGLTIRRRMASCPTMLDEFETGLECAVRFFLAPGHTYPARDIGALGIKVGANDDGGAGFEGRSERDAQADVGTVEKIRRDIAGVAEVVLGFNPHHAAITGSTVDFPSLWAARNGHYLLSPCPSTG